MMVMTSCHAVDGEDGDCRHRPAMKNDNQTWRRRERQVATINNNNDDEYDNGGDDNCDDDNGDGNAAIAANGRGVASTDAAKK